MGILDRLFGSGGEPKEVEYKGYIIRPVPLQIAQVYGAPQHSHRAGKWRLCLYISKGRSDDSKAKEFNAANVYKSKREAVKHCIEFGKQIIDGQVDAFTVTDL